MTSQEHPHNDEAANHRENQGPKHTFRAQGPRKERRDGDAAERKPRREGDFKAERPRRDGDSWERRPRRDGDFKPERPRREFSSDRPARDGNSWERRPRRDGDFNSERPRRDGDFKAERPRRDFNSDRPRRDGDSWERRPRRDGDFNSERPRREFNSDRPRRDGDFNSERPRRDFNSDRPRRDGDTWERRPRRDGDFNSERPRRDGDFNSERPRREFGADRPRRDGDSWERKPRRDGDFKSDRPRREYSSDRPRRDGDTWERKPRREGDSRSERPRHNDDFKPQHAQADDEKWNDISVLNDVSWDDLEQEAKEGTDVQVTSDAENTPENENEQRQETQLDEFEIEPRRKRPIYDAWNPRPPREEELPPAVPYARKHRITVFGGSFDPIHNGHLLLAQKLIDLELTDEVLFVPTRLQPLKQQGPTASDKERLEMLKLALEPYPQFSYTDIELQRTDGPSYTYDTMKTLSQVFVDCEVSLLIGMDSLRTLPLWHRTTELVQHFRFIIYPRPGFTRPSIADFEQVFGMRNTVKLFNAIIPEEKIQLSDISATQIRTNIAGHRRVENLMPDVVDQYIRVNGLYQ